MRLVVSIRLSLVASAFALVGSAASAADYSIPISDAPLRGSKTYELAEPNYPQWAGFYFGVQAGASIVSGDFSGASRSQIATILQNTSQLNDVIDWTILGNASTTVPAFGAFVGYNWQWENIVAGFEANYVRLRSQTLAQSGSVGPIIAADNYTFTVASSASIKITDMMTFRGRFGYTFDRLMPYGFVGLAIGRVDVTRTTRFTQILNPSSADITSLLPGNPQSETKSGLLAYGIAAGLGVEVGILPNLFMRAEWEFIQFAPIQDIKVHVNSARVGVGMKF